jgi:predicted acyltransferase
MSIPTKARYPAIDLLRGMTVCFMIIVNTGGSGAEPYALLQHAEWHGFTPTDLVFPTFLFVVGNALAFTLPNMQDIEHHKAIWKILKRTGLIFLLGYLMYWFPFVRIDETGDWSLKPIAETRILGVLQRIALCYGISALLLRVWSARTICITGILILLSYWAMLSWGGDDTIEGNLVRQIDRLLLGDAHLYHGDDIAFDPEGLLSTLPALINVWAGYLVATHIRKHGNTYKTVADLLVAAIIMLALAYLWDRLFPVNKKLWTSSFSVLTSGLSTAILGWLVYLTEIHHYKMAAGFFSVFGRNPLFIYLLSELMGIIMWAIPAGEKSVYEYVNDNVFQAMLPGPNGSLLFALAVMFTCWIAGRWLDKRQIYIRV